MTVRARANDWRNTGYRLGGTTRVALSLVVLISGTLAVGMAGIATASPLPGLTPSISTPTTTTVANSYAFLDQMMDLYATGTTTRLVQSFSGGTLGAQGFTDSETYDDALVIEAFLAEGSADGVLRAETIGNALLDVQAHDPKADGRIRGAYSPTPFASPTSFKIIDKTTDVGNMAWAGMALVQLAAATGNTAYLSGAEAIGNWIVANCRDTRGAGGFTGGRTSSNHPIKWKSTEHNIDAFALFSMLNAATGNATWATDASWARGFVEAMWNPTARYFYVGTTRSGIKPNKQEQPEDVNSWSYLALRDPSFASSIDWDVQNLSVSAGGFSGVSFCAGDRSGVWFEGTAHLAEALQLRNSPGDAALAAQYLSDIAYAQSNGPNNDGLGIIAASKDGLSDCDGGFYYASLHTGATAWYILASEQIDPFVMPGTG